MPLGDTESTKKVNSSLKGRKSKSTDSPNVERMLGNAKHLDRTMSTPVPRTNIQDDPTLSPIPEYKTAVSYEKSGSEI